MGVPWFSVIPMAKANRFVIKTCLDVSCRGAAIERVGKDQCLGRAWILCRRSPPEKLVLASSTALGWKVRRLAHLTSPFEPTRLPLWPACGFGHEHNPVRA